MHLQIRVQQLINELISVCYGFAWYSNGQIFISDSSFQCKCIVLYFIFFFHARFLSSHSIRAFLQALW